MRLNAVEGAERSARNWPAMREGLSTAERRVASDAEPMRRAAEPCANWRRLTVLMTRYGSPWDTAILVHQDGSGPEPPVVRHAACDLCNQSGARHSCE